MSTLIINGSSGGTAQIRSFNSSDLSAVVTTTTIPVPVGGTPTYATASGRYQSTVTTLTKFNQQLTFTTSGTYATNQSITWSSSDPINAPVSNGGLVTHVTDGTYLITVAFSFPPIKFSIPITLTTQTISSTTFLNWTAGLLGADLNNEVDSRIATNGGTIATTGQLFTSANDTTHVYVRNAANVFHDLDFTGVSVWQSGVGAGAKFQMSLVTPTDAIGILHATPAVGTQFIFVDASNTNYTATVAATTQVDGFALAHLNWSGSIPTTLKVYKVFPSTFQAGAPDGNLNYFPIIGVTQTRQLCVQDVPAAAYTSTLSFYAPTETNRVPFTFNKYSGDSGLPNFAVVKGDLIYMAPNYGTTNGPIVSSYISDINTALAAFSGDTYQLTIANANIETSTWVANVIAAGSTVSSASAAAHDTFITSAKNGGFWSLISRLNTYGANTLAGALVPLVNTVGNSTDTNYNFVSGDFSLAVGLTGDGATKYLDTGALPSSFATTTSLHLAVCTSTNAGNYTGLLMGSEDVGNTNRLEFAENINGNPIFAFYTSANSQVSSYSNAFAPGFYIGSRTGITTSGLYRNGVYEATSPSTGNSPSSLHSIYVHAANGAGSFARPVGDIFQSYSCGSGLTSTQATAYYNALNTLMTALGRTIPA